MTKQSYSQPSQAPPGPSSSSTAIPAEPSSHHPSHKKSPTQPSPHIPTTISTESNAQIREAESLLKSLLAQKQRIDRQNMEIEYRIYNLEGAYLEDTVVGGNIICGFDGYSSGRSDKKRTHRTGIDPSNRIFSNSSTTYKDSLVLAQQLKDVGGDLSVPPPAIPTTSVPRTSKKATAGTSNPPDSTKSKPETPSTPAVKKRKRVVDKSDTPLKHHPPADLHP